MRIVRSLLLGVLVIFTCCTCISVAPPPQRVSTADEIEVLRQETVALVFGSKIYCSGVFIGPSTILTAAHCTDPDLATDEDKFGFVTYSAAIGASEGESFTTRFATLKARDPIADLALLTIDFSIEPHPSASLGGNTESGDRVGIIGHPGGLLWSYTPGFVSGYRSMHGPDGIRGLFLQLWGGIQGGSSGGPAFDSAGHLVGICSFGTKVITMFVSRPSIGAFLAQHS